MDAATTTATAEPVGGPPPVGPTPIVAPGPARPAADPVPLGWVIAAMILFWPTAIPALLSSHRAARAAGSGDVTTAAREGGNAKRWSVISVCVGAALAVLSVLVSVVWVAVAAVAWHHDGGPFTLEGGRTHEQPFDHRGGDGQTLPGDPGPRDGTDPRGNQGSDD
ncbi:CD225/dispanin family protein [Cellulomonas rhizosphaerae]|uniref:CD225/dispanin family protein n=1 Tax=Cellulomonas rhizosphaerae TaxID=2293719 RepID=A0A413RMW0_9CELL|nr:CD225/dispanin family protein [Cellulomonas rhizosphaerae]RHA42633.1 CD225/dispanin family protein [Cellulomonas rhizosphaerae]